MANAFTVVANIRAAKGKEDALAAFLTEQVAAVIKAEPGCLVYRLHRSVTDPAQFCFYEMFKDEAAFELHRNSPHIAAFRERREKEGLIAAPAEVVVYRSVTD
jgi:quinol monooxygenase YgiN